MKKTTEIELKSILKAKEKRSLLKLENAKQGINSLTITLNIPGIPKTNKRINTFFNEVINDFKNHILSYRVGLSFKDKQIIIDKAGDFCIIPFSDENVPASALKRISEIYESEHKVGRLIDVDVFSHNLGHMSSGKEKTCYFCGKHSAISCMRNQRHTYSAIRKKIKNDIESYFTQVRKNRCINMLVNWATRAILYEVSLSPKPGLVDRINSGVHKDMNYYSFLNSSAVLPLYFREFCVLGYSFSEEWEQALPKIRKIGLRAEEKMYQSTDGVNTQKGLLFLMGISLFTYAYLFANSKELSNTNFRNTIKKITNNIVKNELQHASNNVKTHGEKMFKKYQSAGIRQEVEKAFPVIFETAIPYFSHNLKTKTYQNQKKLNQILRNALLKIMTLNNDTTVLFRSNLEVLECIKIKSSQSINNRDEYNKLCRYCEKHNVSPGGSADLLAIALFIFFVNKNTKTIEYEL